MSVCRLRSSLVRSLVDQDFRLLREENVIQICQVRISFFAQSSIFSKSFVLILTGRFIPFYFSLEPQITRLIDRRENREGRERAGKLLIRTWNFLSSLVLLFTFSILSNKKYDSITSCDSQLAPPRKSLKRKWNKIAKTINSFYFLSTH